jgi:hypothetical protein
MTQKQAERAYEMLSAGLEYGKTIAEVTIASFPSGFTEETGTEITKVTEKALTTATDVYALGGIARRYREQFESGFYIALRNGFAEYATDSAARAIKDSAVGR